MSDSKTTKHFETSERSRSLRLRERTYPDTERVFVLLEERQEDGWTQVGNVELGYGPAVARGRCEQEIVAEWYHTEYHGGERIRVGRRLRKQFDHAAMEIVLEEERQVVLGFGRHDEHDWQQIDRWRFDGPGGEQR